MSDLFEQSPKTAPTYSAKDIEVLEGLEPVRRRPGMYIGGTDERAVHHLVAEVLDNAMDEAVAGYAQRIEVVFQADRSVVIRDNGRGIPVDPHPKFPDKSALEVILTTLHSGGKFSDKAYQTSGGLHGVGISVVNALSDFVRVEVARDRMLWVQEYARGEPLTPLESKGEIHNRRGTSFQFHPDPEIFGSHRLEAETVYKMARSKAYLFRGVEIRWSCDPAFVKEGVPETDRIHFPGGLLDYLGRETEGASPVTDPFAGEATLPEGGRLEWAMTWLGEEEKGMTTSYCNTILTPQGGTHETGFRSALLKGLKSYAERVGQKKATQITPEDCFVGVALVLSAFIKQPQFQGQTKEKLVSPQVSRWIESVVKDHFDHWLGRNTTQSNNLLDLLIQRAEERLRRRQSKETGRQSATRRLRLPGKLADCTIETAQGTEIFLVEGDSAGGSAKQARNRTTQAVLALRGKILNVASSSVDKLQSNQELTDLSLALGCGTGKSFQLERLRYEKIIIMTDADVDGAHIASLLMTFFYREMPGLIEAGHLYLAQPPLYRLSQGGTVIYAKDDEAKERFLKEKFSERAKVQISRFKGLGEMPASQLKETTMAPEHRTLLRVCLENGAADEGVSLFVENLMGRKAESRFSFIQENAQFAQIDL